MMCTEYSANVSRRTTLLQSMHFQVEWKWPRRLKVGLLTLAVIAMTVILLFFPEEYSNERVATVIRGDPLIFDLDQAYQEQGRNSEKIMRLELEGSFLPDEATNLAQYVIINALKILFVGRYYVILLY